MIPVPRQLDAQPIAVDLRRVEVNGAEDVTPATTELLVVVYAPIEIGRAQLERVVDVTAERMQQVLGGSETGRSLIGG